MRFNSKKKEWLKVITILWFVTQLASCKKDDDVVSVVEDEDIVLEVDPSLFLTADGYVTVTTVPCTLSDGTETECYQVVSKHTPSDHDMGPWCPEYITDGPDKGGLWITDEGVVDLDGAFIENLATYYKDSGWKMYDEVTGEVIRVETEEQCAEGARPNPPVEYQNMCAQCLPGWIEVEETYLIPKVPVLQSTSTPLGDGPTVDDPDVAYGPYVRGLAFNGVRLDHPADLDVILAAYQLAPVDDAGGHINNALGYHYHGDMGYMTRIEQSDEHAAMIGYALDGHGIYAELDPLGNEATDLDECRGHYDEIRGYHYHVMPLENNEFFDCYYGAWAVD